MGTLRLGPPGVKICMCPSGLAWGQDFYMSLEDMCACTEAKSPYMCFLCYFVVLGMEPGPHVP